MTKMFDKVSDSFMHAIKGVLEAKKTNKHGHDEVGKEDDDIDNDGDVDSSDKYLHNRRKAIGKAMMKKEAVEELDELSHDTLRSYRMKAKSVADHGGEQRTKGRELAGRKSYGGRMAGIEKAKVMAKEEAQLDEISADMKGRYKKAAQHSLDSAQDFKSELDHEGEPKGSRVRKDVNRIIKNRKTGMKRANEEAQIDELSKNKLLDYMDKASDARGHRNLSTKKVDNRYAGVKKASDKLAKEEAELTSEEIAMIEAKMAGVADGSMEGDKHMCATKVFHKEWNEGTPIKTMHAEPDADGLIEWYDVMFDHGIERVMTEDMEILQAESHMHSKKKMKEEVEELDELSKNTMLRYVSANKKETKAAEDKGDYGKSVQRMRGTDMAVRKYTAKPGSKYVRVPATEEVELDEARGRPKKMGAKDFTVHPVTKEKLMHNNPEHMKKIERLQKHGVLEKPKREADQHIMNQLSKAKTSMRGGETIHFTHGESKHVSGTHAAKLLTKYAGMKPSEKEDFQKKIGHSHEQLMKHV